ncbi:MAG: hypothetical protein ACOC8A_01565 [bacterium]
MCEWASRGAVPPRHRRVCTLATVAAFGMSSALCLAQPHAPLPRGVNVVWELSRAHRETTPTRERICINGLWLWQPADPKSERVPGDGWGYFKVPGCWPGITNYMQKDCQTVHAHPSWKDRELADIAAAWYQREITVPATWAGRRIALSAEYLNSFAAVYVDGRKAGEMRFPAGEVDLTELCRAGGTHVLTILVVAIPLEGVMLSYNDSNSARAVRGSVARRGLCGDVYLVGTPPGARIADVKVDTSVRSGAVTFSAALHGIAADAPYALRARVGEDGRIVKAFASRPFRATDLQDGRFVFTAKWQPDKLWDIHTPQNQYDVTFSLLDAAGQVLDTSHPLRFGFREFWIDGRDFYLNGTRIHLCAVPFDNAQVGAAWATYGGARESMERLQSWGINAVYTHNYGCEPGAHLSFAEILRAADDVGMLLALSQPHFGHYKWDAADADRANGYARHAAFYVRVAGSHPSVVMYSMSHNATGYSEDMNPDLIDGIHAVRSEWSRRNARRALRAQAIVERLDPSRVVYHHSSGNLGPMHTANFYPNWVPIQEMSDWFEHWATEGVKPFFTCEYGAPFTWDWSMYRGWYKGHRQFGSATVPWDFCLAEWNAQFLGDRAYQISEQEKGNIRWEARQFRAGNLWHRWDYPHRLGSRDFDERYPILAAYLTDNWRAFRTWGLSAISPWEHGVFWRPRPDLGRNQRVELKTDWESLQRPGFSPDYLEERYERMDLAYERRDWAPTLAAQAMLRNNMPLLAYIGGKPGRFTSKDHNFLAGESVEKQIVVINNSRVPATCQCAWSAALPEPVGGRETVRVETGEVAKLPLSIPLPRDLAAGPYELSMTARFSTGEVQQDAFAIHVLPPRPRPELPAKIALFDPKGETGKLLRALGVAAQRVGAKGDLSPYDLLVVGKGALTPEGAAPDIGGVRHGLKVLVFEQTADALEKRLGFRVAQYGLRRLFRRVPDHPALAGLGDEHLRDWRGEATLLPPRLDYERSSKYGSAPVVRWCGLEVPRLWRCGNRGSVASALIEKPHTGDFLPIIDGGFSLQYSPLLEYREGKGAVLFCQIDVTGRTEQDPAAARLVTNLLSYICEPSAPKTAPNRTALYVGDPVGRRHLERAGVAPGSYDGRALSEEQVLVVGRAGGQALAEHAPQIGRWLKAGGHLLALELDAKQANPFLPTAVRTAKREHIATWFQPPSVRSPFAGVAPADVHNRDPRDLPLVTGVAKTLGNGVLAQAQGGSVVFCQLAPYRFVKRPGDTPGISVDADDAVEGKQCALLTMATVPWGQFGQKVKAGQVGRTYTCAAFVKPLGEPLHVRLEVERAGRPWDRAVRGKDIELPADRWTELHVTFEVVKPYPEGWSAYIHCGQPGARLRADQFRLYEGDYVPRQAGGNLFENPGFEDGTRPYFFTWRTEQQNLRKTYRRTAFLVTRILANMGVRGKTPLLSRFSTPASGAAKESIVKNGGFRADADADRVPEPWQFITEAKGATCTVEPVSPGAARRCVRLACPGLGEGAKGSLMLAQHDVPVQEGQWYLVSLQARSEGFRDARVTLALQNTATWRSLFDYQRFTPREAWQEFTFLVKAKATATSKTRFQIWHGTPGTLWLSDIRMSPCAPPSEGRWSSGLYLDKVQEWDDPYRFFRW